MRPRETRSPGEPCRPSTDAAEVVVGDWIREAAQGRTRWRDDGGAAVPAWWSRRGALSSTATGSAPRDEGTSRDEEARREEAALREGRAPVQGPDRTVEPASSCVTHAAGAVPSAEGGAQGPRPLRRGGTAPSLTHGAVVRCPSAGIERPSGAEGTGERGRARPPWRSGPSVVTRVSAVRAANRGRPTRCRRGATPPARSGGPARCGPRRRTSRPRRGRAAPGRCDPGRPAGP